MFIRFRENVEEPVRHTDGAAGYDLRNAREFDCDLHPNDAYISEIPTGFGVMLPEGYVGLVRIRSGFARRGLVSLGGVIDEDYQGEIVVFVKSLGERIRIRPNERFAQLVVVPYHAHFRTFGAVRGSAGFGSTGEF